MSLVFLLGAIFLAHGMEEPHSHNDRLEALDVQIERLEKVADQYQAKANEMEQAAQPLQLRDWSAFAQAMKEAEDTARLAIQTRRQADKLKEKKQEIIEKQREVHERSHKH